MCNQLNLGNESFKDDVPQVKHILDIRGYRVEEVETYEIPLRMNTYNLLISNISFHTQIIPTKVVPRGEVSHTFQNQCNAKIGGGIGIQKIMHQKKKKESRTVLNAGKLTTNYLHARMRNST